MNGLKNSMVRVGFARVGNGHLLDAVLGSPTDWLSSFPESISACSSRRRATQTPSQARWTRWVGARVLASLPSTSRASLN